MFSDTFFYLRFIKNKQWARTATRQTRTNKCRYTDLLANSFYQFVSHSPSGTKSICSILWPMIPIILLPMKASKNRK